MSQRVADFLKPLTGSASSDINPETKEVYEVNLDPFLSLTLVQNPSLIKGALRDLINAKSNLIEQLDAFWQNSLDNQASWLYNQDFKILTAGAYLDSVVLSRIVKIINGEIWNMDQVYLPTLRNLIPAIDSSDFKASLETLDRWEKVENMDSSWPDYLTIQHTSNMISFFLFILYAKMTGYTYIVNGNTVVSGSTEMAFASSYDIIFSRLVVFAIRGDYDTLFFASPAKFSESKNVEDIDLKSVLEQSEGFNVYNLLIALGDNARNQERAILPLLLNFGSPEPLLPLPVDYRLYTSFYDFGPYKEKVHWLKSLEDRVIDSSHKIDEKARKGKLRPLLY